MNCLNNSRLTKPTPPKPLFSIVVKKIPKMALIIGFCCVATSVMAQNGSSNKNKVEEVVISATRTEKPVSEVANSVSVIDAQQIEKEMANNIDDLIRYDPSVSVAGGGRFGLNGFSIRGIGGDRVLTVVDSTPTADEFSFGPFLSSRRDFVDIDALKSVEIVRGPGSSVYGSNAIGGVVNFITKDPIDYLGDKSFTGSAKVGYGSVDESMNTTLLAAFGNQTWSGMVVGSLRDGSETQSYYSEDITGSARRSRNPQQAESNNTYAKLVYSPSDAHRMTLVAERFSGESETDVLSAAGTSLRGVIINSENGIDERNRERLSFDYRLTTNTALFDTVSLLAYLQSSDAQQNTFSERLSRGSIQDRVRDSFYEQKNSGLRVQLGKVFETGNIDHEFTYGVDYDNSESVTLRTGSTFDRTIGAPVREFTTFPTRDFPNSEYTSVGAFIQDDISLLDGRLHLIPAVRYDSFELEPAADPIYLSGNTGSPTPEGYDESEVSAKIGVVYDFTENWSVFAQYAEGFRAPSLDAVNTGFTNFVGGYTTLSNPDLRPERGRSTEIGLRRFSDSGSFELTVYKNTYDDFIESLAVRGFNPITQLLEFQARNLDQAEISGFELKAQYDLSQIVFSLEGFNLRAAYAYSDGENKQTNSPINSIDPQQLVLGVGYAPVADNWSVEAVVVAASRKEVNDIDASSLAARGAPGLAAFETPGYATLDLIGHYKIGDLARVNLGVFNVTDKEHFQWSEEFIQDPASTNFARLTESGRNYSVTVKFDF